VIARLIEAVFADSFGLSCTWDFHAFGPSLHNRTIWRSRSLLAAWLVAVGLCMSGCDAGYEVVVENLSDRTIVVRTEYLGVTTVKPCMADVGYPSGPSTFSDELHLEVFSQEGDLLDEQTLETISTSGGLRRALIRYEGPGSDLCPLPAVDLVRVEVANKTEKDLTVTIDTQNTVQVQSSALVTVTVRGSITGQQPRISVASANPGFRLAERYWVSDGVLPYRIGDPPLLRVVIRTASRTYRD
jgi:hypothetical protein